MASGPSVSEFDFDSVRGMKTIALKDGHFKVPHADVFKLGDHRYAKRNPDLSTYKGPLILYCEEFDIPVEWRDDDRVEFIPKVPGRGLSDDPCELRGTFSSTCLAINYAVLRGASEIWLVGVDGKPGVGGRRWFNREETEDWHERYRKQKWGYSRLVDDLRRKNIRVYNLNPDTAVTTFPVLRRK